ncbi:MFS general substrate transporter [Acrodontium crateriforme]|uniref:MFS general substrate transporter n=1 Tax=Acrodontium crateriforme TaxID=150365 RepID=A0AAQ3RA37_9PEZI|nr:MFS general substrate transporter [Acrodontium crateriforme]
MASAWAHTGSFIPAYVPRSSNLVACLLVACSIITSTTFGYDGSMLNGLNILPSYTNYFNLNAATTGLQTAAVFIGGCLSALCWGQFTDWVGRRASLFWAAVITIFAIILQTAAQNTAMFTIARIIIGFGNVASGCAGPPYLAETLPLHWRGWGLGFFNDAYYVGALIAAGITYATFQMEGTWAWRIPSLVQAVFSIVSILILPFVPESPRWLANRGQRESALEVLAQTYADGDRNSPVVQVAFKEIVDTLEYEKNHGQKKTFAQCFKTRSARRRILLACSAAVFSTIAGNVIATYYLGDLLTNAGISDAKTQLEINIILNAFALVCAVAGTLGIDKVGRKPTALISTTLLTVFLFMVGILTALYGTSNNKSGSYATVACVFLFLGAYSYGWTPLLYLYPPEVLNYPIRAVGVGVFQLVENLVAVLMTFTMPIALNKLGWKTYMINGAWDVFMIAAVAFFWVETKGKSLEELDVVFEGEKHSDAPDLEQVYADEKMGGRDVQHLAESKL